MPVIGPARPAWEYATDWAAWVALSRETPHNGGPVFMEERVPGGERVLLVEKQRHPRFHIGESLLPMNMLPFDEPGVGDEVARIGLAKCEFIDRINRPAIGSLFMRPANPFHMHETVLLLLSGDVFRPSPIHTRLRLLKFGYYLNAMAAELARLAVRPVARASKI